MEALGTEPQKAEHAALGHPGLFSLATGHGNFAPVEQSRRPGCLTTGPSAIPEEQMNIDSDMF